jgi:hypothetical protein
LQTVVKITPSIKAIDMIAKEGQQLQSVGTSANKAEARNQSYSIADERESINADRENQQLPKQQQNVKQHDPSCCSQGSQSKFNNETYLSIRLLPTLVAAPPVIPYFLLHLSPNPCLHSNHHIKHRLLERFTFEPSIRQETMVRCTI